MMGRGIFILILVLIIILAGLGFFYIQRTTKVITPIPTPTSQPSSTPSSQILFPQGGESLIKGQTYTLKWSDGGGSTTQVFLINTNLESQGESVATVDKKFNIQNTGSYSYTIPQTIPNGNYKFEIGNLTSNPFQIISESNTISYCSSSNLQAFLNLSPAAGNIYGTFTLKNISNQSCSISGGNFIEVSYPNSIKNISVTHVGQTQSQPFTLSPNQTLYSQVHHPNGPQCQGPTQQVNVSFSYKISPTNSITFNTEGNTPAIVQDCQGPEVTQIQIWQMSTQPITPQ